MSSRREEWSGAAGRRTLQVAEQVLAGDSASYYLTGDQAAALEHAGNVRHVHGDTIIGGGSFDGILVVDGALTITGPFVATGVIVARGRIDARAGGLVVTGSLMSFAAGGRGRERDRSGIRYGPVFGVRGSAGASHGSPTSTGSSAKLGRALLGV